MSKENKMPDMSKMFEQFNDQLKNIISKPMDELGKILDNENLYGLSGTHVYKFALREDLKDDKRFLPTRATSKSAGWDVSCAFEDHKDLIVKPGEYIKIPLGFRSIPPEGYWFEVKSRSSSFTKKKLHALYGTVDQDYRGYCLYCAKYDGDEDMTLSFGEKIAQIIPVKMLEMEVAELSNDDYDKICEKETNERGSGGFGSTSG